MPKFNIDMASGSRQEVDIELEDYKAAGIVGQSLSQYLNTKYPTASDGPTAFEQAMAQAGLFVKHNADSGISVPTMAQVLNGTVEINTGAITRNDGVGNNTPSGRLLFPEVILQIIQSELTTDSTDFLQGYEGMIAINQSVSSPKVDQPIINVTGPAGAEYANQPIAQLAEPAAMITITVGEKSFRIPTKSIGLTISDEALGATTLDLVGLAMSAQSRQERIRMVESSISAMVNGDADLNEVALASRKANTIDSNIVAAGAITHTAWIKYLRTEYQKRSISHILCDIDTALALENRAGKPNVQTDDPRSPRIDTLFSVENLGIQPPRVLLLEPALIGANTVVGLDSRYAIRRVVNVSASYSAIEQYVMRRATSFRVDYGEMSQKLMIDAWDKMTLTL